MQTADAYTVDELFQEAADLAREQGVSDEAMWAEVVDEVVEGHLALGEFDEDEDIEGIREELRKKWGEYRRETVKEEVGQEEDTKPEQEKGEGWGQAEEDEQI